MADHPDREEIIRLIASTPGDLEPTLLHLLVCFRCRRRAIEKAVQELPNEEVQPGLSKLWDRAGEIELQWEAEIEKDRQSASELLREMRDHPARRSEFLKDPRFHSPVLAGLLAAASERESLPAARAALAGLAFEIAAKIDVQRFPAALAAEVKALAACALAEAERRLSGHEEAWRILHLATADLTDRPLDSPERAMLCYGLGRLLKAEGRKDEALALLGRAALLFEDHDRLHDLAMARLEEGWLRLEDEEPDTAEAALLEAMDLLEPRLDPRAALRARYGFAICCAELGRRAVARLMVREARQLHDLLPDNRNRQQALLWEAEVAKRSGRYRTAVKLMRSVLAELLEEGAQEDAALLVLHILEVYLVSGEKKELGRFCREHHPALRFQRLPASTALLLAAVLAFAAAGDRTTPRLLSAVATFLKMSRLQPDLPFPRREPVAELAWDDLLPEDREKLCGAVRMDGKLAGRSSCEIDPERAEVISWIFELLTGTRVTFAGARPVL